MSNNEIVELLPFQVRVTLDRTPAADDNNNTNDRSRVLFLRDEADIQAADDSTGRLSRRESRTEERDDAKKKKRKKKKKMAESGVITIDTRALQVTSSALAGFLTREVRNYLDAFFYNELSRQANSINGTLYAPFQFVLLLNKPERSSVTDTVISSYYEAASVFRKDQDLPIPTSRAVLAIQIDAFENDVDRNDENDIDEFLSERLRNETLRRGNNDQEGEAEDAVTVVSVRTDLVPDSPSLSPGADTNNNDDGDNNNNGQLNTVIIVAVVLAACAMVVLGAALFVAWRKKKRREEAFKIGSGGGVPVGAGVAAGGAGTTLHSRSDHREKKKKNKNKNRRGGAGPSTAATSSSSSGKPANKTDNDGDVDVEGEGVNTSGVLYPESVISDDINTSITQYYQSGLGGGANNGTGNMKNGQMNDAASVSSMESYGYSLDGYASSIAPSTHYGY